MDTAARFTYMAQQLANAAQALNTAATALKPTDHIQQGLRLELLIYAEEFQLLSTQLWNDETFPNYTYNRIKLRRYCALNQITKILRPDVKVVIECLAEFPNTEEIQSTLTKLLQTITECEAAEGWYR